MLSSRFVLGFPEQRLAYLAEKIAEARADYCIVIAPQTHRFLGILRIAETATQEGSHNRILCDLLGEAEAVKAPADTVADAIEKLLAKSTWGALPLVDREGSFVGLITNESYAEWQLHARAKKSEKTGCPPSSATVVSFEAPPDNQQQRDA